MRTALLAALALSGCFLTRSGFIREAVNRVDATCADKEIDWSEDRSWLWRVTGCNVPIWCSESPSDRTLVCSLTKPLTEEDRRLAAAAARLKCPAKRVVMERVDLPDGDPLREVWGWWVDEFSGCGLAIWCGEPNGPRAGVCEPSADYDTVSAQLALETQCPREQIQPVQRQVFTRRTIIAAEKGRPLEIRLQVSWRLDACGRPYVCSVTGGLAPAVVCKAALDAVGAPPPPAPSSGP